MLWLKYTEAERERAEVVMNKLAEWGYIQLCEDDNSDHFVMVMVGVWDKTIKDMREDYKEAKSILKR